MKNQPIRSGSQPQQPERAQILDHDAILGLKIDLATLTPEEFDRKYLS